VNDHGVVTEHSVNRHDNPRASSLMAHRWIGREQGKGTREGKGDIASLVTTDQLRDSTSTSPEQRARVHQPEPCAWLAGCDQPPAYLAIYQLCDNPKCTPDDCCGALLCETHAAVERANPTLVRLTALAGARR
jgi:hypothetical protein